MSPSCTTTRTIWIQGLAFLRASHAKIAFLLFRQHFTSASRTSLSRPKASSRLGQAKYGTIDGASSASIIPILRPVLLDGTTRLSHILEISSTEILMLLNV